MRIPQDRRGMGAKGLGLVGKKVLNIYVTKR
jgi:hypothetical protein